MTTTKPTATAGHGSAVPVSGEIPKTAAEAIRRLRDSGTGQSKVADMVIVLQELTVEKKAVVLPLELHAKLTENLHAEPVRFPHVPQGTLDKLERLIKTGSTDLPPLTDEQGLTLEQSLEQLEKLPGEVKARPKAAEFGKPAKVQHVGSFDT